MPGREPSRRDLLARRHRRAEALLGSADEGSRASLVQRAVVLTLDLADAVARRYAGRGLEHEDLRQVAREGLVKAAWRFRPGRGAGFEAYALPTITGEVRRHFRDHAWLVRPPRSVQQAHQGLLCAEEELRHRLGREPEDHELAHHLRLGPAGVLEARACAGGYVAASLDAVDPTGRPLVASMALADDGLLACEDRVLLARALGVLSARERRIVRLRFVDELPQREIGRRLGVSQMQVSRLLRGILDRLRAELADSAA